MQGGLMRIGLPHAGRGHPPRAGPAPAVPPLRRTRRGTSGGATSPERGMVGFHGRDLSPKIVESGNTESGFGSTGKKDSRASTLKSGLVTTCSSTTTNFVGCGVRRSLRFASAVAARAWAVGNPAAIHSLAWETPLGSSSSHPRASGIPHSSVDNPTAPTLQHVGGGRRP